MRLNPFPGTSPRLGNVFNRARQTSAAVLVSVILAACGSNSAGSNSASNSPFVIGSLLVKSGTLSNTGAGPAVSIPMAVNAINKDGGAAGHKIQVITEDTAGSPTQAVAAAQKLIVQDHVNVLIGDGYTPDVLAVEPLAERYGVPLLDYNATGDAVVAKPNPYIFQLAEPLSAETKAVLWYATTQLHYKRFLILGGTDAFSAQDIADFQKSAPAFGATVVGTVEYNAASTTNYLPYLTKYKPSSYDAVFLGGSVESALIVRQAAADGMQLHYLALGAVHLPTSYQVGGAALNGAISSLSYPGLGANGDQYLTPKGKQFMSAWLAKKEPASESFDASHAYETVYLLASAIEASQALKGSTLAAAIKKAATNRSGYFGPYTLLPNQGVELQVHEFAWKPGGSLAVVASAPNSAVYGS